MSASTSAPSSQQQQLNSITPSSTVSNKLLRRLPNRWKKANLVYQILILVIGAANVCMTAIDDGKGGVIPPMYFEIVSCILAVTPFVWSKILDQVKTYVDVSDPNYSSQTTTPQTTTPQIREETQIQHQLHVQQEMQTVLVEPQVVQAVTSTSEPVASVQSS